MLRYFPFSEKYDLKMGTTALASELDVVECDEHYEKEVMLKRKLLSEKHAYYFQSNKNTMQAQWEVLALVLKALSEKYPDSFSLKKNEERWHWHNKRLNENQDFVFGDATSLPLEPLDWAGRQVQEDLVLLDGASMLVAGQLCFPSGWCMQDKMNRHFLEIHNPLPRLTDPMIKSASTLVERIPPHRPLTRNNWGFRVCDWLDLSARQSDAYKKLLHESSETFTIDTIGDKVFLRVEHQTLSRLPNSGHLLFSIHTYQGKVKEEMNDPQRAAVLGSFLETVPPDMLEYKLMTPFIKMLREYVNQNQQIER